MTTTLLDHLDGRTMSDARPADDLTAPARRLRATMAAARVAFTTRHAGCTLRDASR